METDGQSGQPLCKPSDEPKKLASVHIGHIAGDLPAPEEDFQELRDTAGLPQRERILQNIHGEPDEQMQTSGAAVQGSKGENLR